MTVVPMTVAVLVQGMNLGLVMVGVTTQIIMLTVLGMVVIAVNLPV